jgi:hypothetical protein
VGFCYLALDEAVEVMPVMATSSPVGGTPMMITLMGSMESPTDHNLIPFGDHVFDGESSVGEGTERD